MAEILIVEDENAIANLIRTTLSIPGHSVERAPDGLTALEMVGEAHYDLVVLDLMLGDIAGEEVLSELVKKDIPVIVVSAKSALSNQILCLRMGADDYITKPFHSIDLATRVEVVLRVHHKHQAKEAVLTFRHLTINQSKYEVLCHGSVVALTPKEYELLLFFVTNTGKVFSRRQIITEVWDYSFTKDNRTVDIHIQRLRKKLGLQELLKTITKIGYVLESQANETPHENA